jgi:hypothetical protein
MPRIHSGHAFLAGALLLLATAVAQSQNGSNVGPIERAQHQITEYLSNLANLHCTESVTQEKLGDNGHVETTERAQYDYLTMMSGTGDEFQLNESRIESSSNHRKGPKASMMVTNGVATVLLVFHPYYRDSFNFSVGNEEPINGRMAVPVHFTHIPGRRTPIALALQGREFPLDLQGTAWLDEQSGEVVKIDANLVHDMADLGLHTMHIQVEYKATRLTNDANYTTLPALAVVDVSTTHQHWRNTHVFDRYKSFATGAEQDPRVTIHAENPASASGDTGIATTSVPKEKP